MHFISEMAAIHTRIKSLQGSLVKLAPSLELRVITENNQYLISFFVNSLHLKKWPKAICYHICPHSNTQDCCSYLTSRNTEIQKVKQPPSGYQSLIMLNQQLTSSFLNWWFSDVPMLCKYIIDMLHLLLKTYSFVKIRFYRKKEKTHLKEKFSRSFCL